MKRIFLFPLLALLMAFGASAQSDPKQPLVYGVAFYNLENLFDTINNNGQYDLEFSPDGARQWNGAKYWSKINNLAYCISRMVTKNTPMGPAIIGVSEIENKSCLDDLVRAKDIRQWRLQVVHHDSPDRRGVDVGLLYNPRLFKVLDVTNHRLVIPGYAEFRTRDQMLITGPRVSADRNVRAICAKQQPNSPNRSPTPSGPSVPIRASSLWVTSMTIRRTNHAR